MKWETRENLNWVYVTNTTLCTKGLSTLAWNVYGKIWVWYDIERWIGIEYYMEI